METIVKGANMESSSKGEVWKICAEKYAFFLKVKDVMKEVFLTGEDDILKPTNDANLKFSEQTMAALQSRLWQTAVECTSDICDILCECEDYEGKKERPQLCNILEGRIKNVPEDASAKEYAKVFADVAKEMWDPKESVFATSYIYAKVLAHIAKTIDPMLCYIDKGPDDFMELPF